jgi:calcineurin-like phosphoesterase family protein
MTTNIWLTSDTHFNHANIIRYCDRPFVDPQEMNEKLIENWNSVVKHNDHVYHLGDVYMGDKENIHKVLSRLNGKKRLILGNHDEVKDGVLVKYFEKIMVWRYFKGERLLLTHVPVHPSNLVGGEGTRNAHGHIHEKMIPDERYINLCVEHTNYTPVPLEEAFGFKSFRVTPPTSVGHVSAETDWGPDVGREVLPN